MKHLHQTASARLHFWSVYMSQTAVPFFFFLLTHAIIGAFSSLLQALP